MKKILFLCLFLAFNALSYSQTKIKIWRTLDLGTESKSILLQKNGYNKKEAAYNKKLVSEITISETKQTIKLVQVSLKDLGLDFHGRYIDYEKVCIAAKKKGLKLCPKEVVLQLPLQYSHKNIRRDTAFQLIIGTDVFKNKADAKGSYIWKEIPIYYVDTYHSNQSESTSFVSFVTEGPQGTDQYEPLEGNFIFVL